MATNSKIEWLARPGTTPQTWNPVVGCSPASAGCLNCYAAAMSHRFDGTLTTMKDGRATFNGNVGQTQYLYRPLHWRKPRTVFVCSTSDLFHENVPGDFIRHVLSVIRQTWKHTYILLTKRAERLPDFNPYPENCWVGVTVENQANVSRLDSLAKVKAPVRFISFEPLISEVFVAREIHKQFDWSIIGGESGPKARPCKEHWISNLCLKPGPPAFVKQVGKVLGKLWEPGTKSTKGNNIDAWPESLRIREWPR